MRLKYIIYSLLLVVLFASCGVHKGIQRRGKGVTSVSLSDAEQRRYNYYYLEAIRLKAQNEYDAAFDLLQHCLAIDPTAASALYEISQYYLFLKMPFKAQEALEAAVANDPENYWYAQALASLYQEQNERDKTIALLEDMSRRFPDRRESLFLLVDQYGLKGDSDKVITTLDRIESLLGKSEQLSTEKFRIYLQMNQTQKAFDEIEGLVAEYPMDYRYRVLLGDLYLQNEKKQEAYDTYQQVLAAEPDNPMALLSMASYYQQAGQPDLYRQQLDKLLFEKQVPVDTKLNVMRELIMQNEQAKGDSTQIMGLFDEIIALDTEDDQIPMLYAQYLWSKNEFQASIPVLKRILRIDPTNKAAGLMLLRIALQNNDYALVKKVCESAINATPDALDFYFYLTLAYNQDGEYERALRVCQKGLEYITPQTSKELVSDFYSIMGDLYHSLNKSEESYKAYDMALSYNSNNIGALNNYAYYLSVERKDLDKAEEMSYKTVKAEPTNATYLDTYAWILFEKGNYTEARIYIDDAMKNGGAESDVVVEHCGDIYYMNGDVAAALKYWQQSLDMGNTSKTLQEKIRKKKYMAE